MIGYDCYQQITGSSTVPEVHAAKSQTDMIWNLIIMKKRYNELIIADVHLNAGY